MNNSTHPQLTHRCPPESLTCWFSECKRRVLLALSLAAFHFVTPIHAAIITWSGSAGDTFWSTPGNWSSGSVPGPSDNVIFGNLGASEAPLAIGGAVNNFVDGEILSSINSLRYGNIIGFHNSSLANPLIVRSDSATDVAFVADDGQPSIFFVGSAQADGAADVVYTSITGSSLFVSNVNAGISVMQASATNGPHRATLDMSALNTFTCVVSNILVGHDFGVPSRIVETVIAVNDQRKRAMARKVIDICGGNVRGRTIAVLGLTFKPNTDDMRDAPSIAVITALQDAGAKVRAYDPVGMKQAKGLLDNVEYSSDPYACAEGADALVICTEWDEFRALDVERVRAKLRKPILVDLRNIYRPEEMARQHFTYVSVGRPPAGKEA